MEVNTKWQKAMEVVRTSDSIVLAAGDPSIEFRHSELARHELVQDYSDVYMQRPRDTCLSNLDWWSTKDYIGHDTSAMDYKDHWFTRAGSQEGSAKVKI